MTFTLSPLPTNAMAVNFDKLWKKTRNATNEAESVRTLAEILSSKDGRKFILDLESADALLCIEILDQVSSNPSIDHPRQSPTDMMVQGLAEHKFDPSEKQLFFNTLRRLAGKHSRLPKSMVIKSKINFSASGHPDMSGGFADIKKGDYKGYPVAVKTMRVSMEDNLAKIRSVSWK